MPLDDLSGPHDTGAVATAPDCPHTALRAAIQRDPRDLVALSELLDVLLSTMNDNEAEELARRALRHSPASSGAHYLLGRALKRQRPSPAAWHFEQSMRLSGDRHPVTVTALAECRQAQGDIATARALFQEVLAALPDNPVALLNLARLEEKDRDTEACMALLDRVDTLEPPPSTARLAQAVRSEVLARTGDLEGALAILDGVVGPDHNGIHAGLERGRVLIRLGRHNEAFASMTAAKRDQAVLYGHTYEAERAEECAAAARGFFTTANMALLPRADVRRDVAQPVFIVGFPRSGTTLMEQSLSAHPNIAAGGEMLHMDDLAKRSAGLLGSPLVYPEALSELWMADHRHDADLLRDWYLRRAQDSGAVQPGKALFTDKANGNEWHIGLIAVAFPEAPIIRMIRHPLDAILSVWGHEMDYGFAFGLSLETAARHYALVANLTDDLLSRWDHRCLTVRYEDVVDRQEETMRRVLEHVGEPFDARCLAFHQNRRYGHTESHAQVAEPLYARARGRYRDYLEHLAPAVAILGTTMERRDYRV